MNGTGSTLKQSKIRSRVLRRSRYILRVAYDEDEMPAVTFDHSDSDAVWRERDLDSPPARERRNC